MDESLIGKECVYVDNVTHNKLYDGKKLGKVIKEGIHPTYKLPIVEFQKPFLGFCWQYKSNVKIIE